MRKTIVGLFILVLFFTSLSFADKAVIFSELGPYNGYPIGVLIPMSGTLGPKGEAVLDSLGLALSDINKYLEEIKNHSRLKLVVCDSGSDPEISMQSVRKMNDAGIKLVIGPLDSESAKYILDYANDNDMILLSPTTSSPELSIPGDNLMRMVPDDVMHAKALARLIYEQGKRVCVSVFREDEWGNEFYTAFEKAFGDLGGVIAAKIGYSAQNSDFSVTINTLEEKVEEIIFQYPIDLIAVQLSAYLEGIPLLAEAGNSKLLSRISWYSQEILANEPELLVNEKAAKFAVDSKLTCSVFSQDPDILTTPRMVLQDMVIRDSICKYTKNAGDQWTLPAWDALWLYTLALVDKGFSANSVDLRDFILESAKKYIGVSAHLRLNENGDRKYGDYAFYKVAESDSGKYSWNLIAAYNNVFGEEYFRYIDKDKKEEYVNSSETLKIGILIPLSGEGATSGKSVYAGIQAAFEDMTNSGYLKENGKNLELYVEDTYSKGEIALEKLKIMNQSGIKIVIGPCLSQVIETVKDFAQEHGMTLISPASDAPSLALEEDVLFRFVPNAFHQGNILSEMILNKGMNTVIPIWRNDIWGSELKDAISGRIKESGGNVLKGVAYDTDTSDYKGILREISKQISQNPGQKIAVVLLSFDEGLKILEEAADFPEFENTCWYGSESLCQNTSMLEDSELSSFALEREFTCPSYALEIFGNSDSIPLSIPRIALSTRIFDKLGGNPVVYAYTAWDSLWTAFMAWNSYDAKSNADFGESLSKTAGNLIGISNFLGLDKAGDRSNANYDFYVFTKSSDDDGKYQWKKTATYFSNPFKKQPIWFYY